MYQVLYICVVILAFINGIYLIYRFVTMPKRDLQYTLKYRKKKITPPWEQEGGDE